MLKTEDIDRLDSLLKIDINLYKFYKGLINNQITSKSELEKDTILILINEVLIQESALLCDFFEPNKAYEAISYLEKKLSKNNDVYSLDIIYFNNDERQSAIKRMINFLTPYANQSQYFYSQCKGAVRDAINEDISKRNFILSQRLAERIFTDNLYIFLNNIDNVIEKLDGPYKDELVKLRYQILYQNPFVETNYFTVDYRKVDCTDLDTKCLFEFDALKGSIELAIAVGESYDCLSKIYSNKGFLINLEKLKKYDDIDLNDPKKAGEILLLLEYLRTMIVSMDMDQIKEIREKLETEFHGDLNNVIFENVSMILSEKKVETEKNKHRVISLSRNT